MCEFFIFRAFLLYNLLDDDDNDGYEENSDNEDRGFNQNAPAGENFFDDEDQDADREELRKKIGTKKLAKLEEKRDRRERNEVSILFGNGRPRFCSRKLNPKIKIKSGFITRD